MNSKEKKELSESDICAKFITPAIIQAGWDEMQQIRREVTLTPGPIIVRGNVSSRNKKKKKFADYVLSWEPGIQPFTGKGLMSFLVPLPPLAEQHRIVAKVNELMTLCDSLKARRAAAQTTQIHLADTIVEQAVA
jgi:hypothetical protein